MTKKAYFLVYIIIALLLLATPFSSQLYAQDDFDSSEEKSLIREKDDENETAVTVKLDNINFISQITEETKDVHISASRGAPESINEMIHIAKRFGIVMLNQAVVDTKAISTGSYLSIDVFDDKTYIIHIETASKEKDINSLIGRVLDSENGYFLMSSHDGIALASLKLPGENKEYYIAYNHELSNYYIYEIYLDELPTPRFAAPLNPNNLGNDPDGLANQRSGINEYDTSDDTQSTEQQISNTEITGGEPSDLATIDVLVVYTPATEAWAFNNATSIENAVNLAHMDGQVVLNNSLAGVTLSQVSTRRADYIESGDQQTDILRLTFTETKTIDGDTYECGDFLNEVHAWRDETGADLVTLLMTHSNSQPGGDDSAGIAWLLEGSDLPGGSPDYAFSVSDIWYYRQYVQIHEIGHNMGAGHHKYQNDQSGPQYYDYSAGWRYKVNDTWYNTVMAYSKGSYYERPEDGNGINSTPVPYFSTPDPDLSHSGVFRGHDNDADNARTIRENKHIIAAYRPTAGTTEPGSIQSFIEPEGARNDGAKWRLRSEDEIFFHDFNNVSGYHGWIRTPETAWDLSENAMVTSGENDKFVSARSGNINYADFDYSVRMRRLDSPKSAQHLVVRAGNEYDTNFNHWYPGYYFGYTNALKYSIWKYDMDGTESVIQEWTESSAIFQNDWNTLRVIAVGNFFEFYINGTLVNTFSDGSHNEGRIGVIMYRHLTNDPSTTSLEVDWAMLSQAPVSAGTATVEPEQETLNMAALESEVESSPKSSPGNPKPDGTTAENSQFENPAWNIQSEQLSYSTEWKNSGETITGLAPGNYTVTFKDVAGWMKPTDISIYLGVGEKAVRTGTYTDSGSAPTRVGVHRDNTFYLDADGDLNFDSAIDRYSNFGTPDDIPVIGDWNGDGHDQIGIRRDNTFYLDYNDNMAWEFPGDIFGNFGVATDTILIGDWNGDGKDQVGVWREGTFYLDYDGNLDFDPAVDKMYSFGASDGTPIIGDWNGDGKDQIGLRHGSIFYLDYDGDGSWDEAHDRMGSFGLAADTILIGDWSGDGKDQIGVHRDNTFYLDYDGDLNFDAAIDKFANFGTPDDIPIIGDWNGDGKDQIGIRRGPTFYLDYNENMAWEYPGDIFGNFGISTDEILLGSWRP